MPKTNETTIPEIVAVLKETLRNRRAVLTRQVQHKMISTREMNRTVQGLEAAIAIVEAQSHQA